MHVWSVFEGRKGTMFWSGVLTKWVELRWYKGPARRYLFKRITLRKYFSIDNKGCVEERKEEVIFISLTVLLIITSPGPTTLHYLWVHGLIILVIRTWNCFDTFRGFSLLPCLEHMSDSSTTTLVARDSILGQLGRVLQTRWGNLCSVRAAIKVIRTEAILVLQHLIMNNAKLRKFIKHDCLWLEILARLRQKVWLDFQQQQASREWLTH